MRLYIYTHTRMYILIHKLLMEELSDWVWRIKKKKSQAQMVCLDCLHGNQMGRIEVET